jgi:hypothetical protein
VAQGQALEAVEQQRAAGDQQDGLGEQLAQAQPLCSVVSDWWCSRMSWTASRPGPNGKRSRLGRAIQAGMRPGGNEATAGHEPDADHDPGQDLDAA